MTKDLNKLNEYKQRHKEWRDISVTQLSNVNNILITLSTGLLALGLKSEKGNDISCPEKISFILLAISICYGIAVLFSRLYDFRISRHITLTRQRFYKEQRKEDKEDKDRLLSPWLRGNYEVIDKNKEDKDRLLPDNNLGKFNYCDRIITFLQILMCKIDFINKDDIETKPITEIKSRFNSLRKKSKILGEATWIWTKYQVFFFLSSAIIYLTIQLIKF